MTVTRGSVGMDDVDRFQAAGYTSQHVLGIALAIACKTLSNYTNHLAGTEVDAAMADYVLSDDSNAENAA